MSGESSTIPQKKRMVLKSQSRQSVVSIRDHCEIERVNHGPLVFISDTNIGMWADDSDGVFFTRLSL